MKVALVRRQFSATGGAELYASRLLEALVTAGHQPVLITESWRDPQPGITVCPVAPSGRRTQRAWRFAAAVQQTLERHPVDVVLSLERTFRQDVYRAGDGVHRVWLERRREFSPWWRRPFVGRSAFHRRMLALEKLTLDPRNTQWIITNSDMVRREIISSAGFPEERLVLVRNGIDPDRWRSGSRQLGRTQFGFADDDFVLLFAGSGWERKGLSFALSAVAGLPPHHKLLVAGKGRPPWRTPPHVVFAGSSTPLEHLYASADLLLLLPIYDPAANVVFEALAAGLPVVTSRQNGAAEVIRPGVDGTVIDDPADIAAVCRAVLAWHPARRVPPRLEFTMVRNAHETLAVLERAQQAHAT